jgi:UDP-3-O-[3-hydroxymyristoyl] N-acetylglucosamine deacetylase
MIRQRTIREKIGCTGVGLHSGRPIRLELLPAPDDTGISFVRTDLKAHAEIRAHVDCVSDTRLATTLAAGVNGSRAQVSTVEHLLSALAGCGVDNLQVQVDGPEIPILDGSAAGFVEMLAVAGLEEQRKAKRYLVIKREVKVRDGDKVAKVSPGKGLAITCALDFDHPLIAPTPFKYAFTEASFRREISRARTFGFLKDVEALQQKGLARGASLDNAIAIDGYRVLNPEGLRYSDEFVRHKVLDAIGDLALLGMPLIGKVSLERSGHALHTQLVRALLSDLRNFQVVEPTSELAREAVLGEGGVPVFEPVTA